MPVQNWKVTGPARCEDCERVGFLITDHNGVLFGCRPTHTEAMNYAQHKARELGRKVTP